MKKFLISVITVLSLLAPKSFAVDGEIIFKDALYGAAVGGLAGGALYLVDSNDFGAKVGIGVFIGLIAGAAIGFYESQGAFVEIKNGKVQVAFPDVKVEKNQVDTMTKVYLLGARF
jgi:hypothetical protein